MNQRTLARIIGQLFRAPEGDGKGGGGGGETVTPADARTFLADFGHGADALKAMADADVVKLHGTVNANYTKRTQAESKAAAEKAKTARLEAAKGIKLELPKDSKLHQSDVERITNYAREHGLTVEEAKRELESNHAAVSAFELRQLETLKARRAEWVEAVKKDPKLGGDKLSVTQRNAQRAIDRFMPNSKDAEGKDVIHPLRAELRTTGYGDHPLIVALLNDIGAAMAEDGGIHGGDAGGTGELSAADKLYGKTS